MGKGLLASLPVLAVSAGLALAQAPAPSSSYGPSAAAPSGGWNEPMPLNAGGPGGGFSAGGPGCPAPAGPPSLPANLKNAFDAPEDCCPGSHYWFTGEYLHWWMHRQKVPLVTTVAEPGGSGTAGQPGILGQTGTQILFGGTQGENEYHPGARFTAGYALPFVPVAVEGRFFFLQDHTDHFRASADNTGDPPLSRPIQNSLTGEETALSVSFPGQFTGTVTGTDSRSLIDAEANLLVQVGGCWYFPDVVVGFRYAKLREGLGVSQQSTVLPGGLVGSGGSFFGPGTVVTIGDEFGTRNEFYGGQIGVQEQLDGDLFFLQVRGTVALGETRKHSTILGNTTITPPGGGTTSFAGGLLAQPSNIRATTDSEFSVIPELTATIGWHMHRYVDAFIGYDFLYWTDVIRPQTLDRAVNPTQLSTSIQSGGGLVGQARPVGLDSTNFWAQGITFGVSFHY